MSIQPPSDLLLDVVRAADPRKAQAIAARLQQASSANPAADPLAFDRVMADSAALLDGAGDAPAAAGEADAGSAGFEPASPLAMTSSTALLNATVLSTRGPSATPDAYRRFEAMVLGQFVEQMLPRSSAVMYGEGTAGQVWRSMLAERIANEIAKAGGVGIAARVAEREALVGGAS
ncbi:rod-binding protein [Prosthecomicrobium pneumaticum]|uniref:Flagellar protein FlgJ N-terminal domain-containing protein n=1 Tax=Prosthecomicrobium pneumaticum TaxID=81895 RepID=A0A7W9FIU4_9HYPH|nr:rod-binding protein [Prosthecomicrobium pneumaticum]MBB5751047.1 hypothetical protein [Prosthecomicrobium pneumaticum]